jgi:hypothetical protein
MPPAKNVGEPCAGEPHARFDAAAGGNQASRRRRAASAPPADPTATRCAQDARAIRRAGLGVADGAAGSRLYESPQRGGPFGPNSTTPPRARVSCFAGQRRRAGTAGSRPTRGSEIGSGREGSLRPCVLGCMDPDRRTSDGQTEVCGCLADSWLFRSTMKCPPSATNAHACDGA